MRRAECCTQTQRPGLSLQSSKLPTQTPPNQHRHRHRHTHKPNSMAPILGTDKLPAARLALTCGVCRQPYGACIQCAGSSKCYSAFHATCARDAGYRMAVQGGDLMGGDDDDEEEEEEEAEAGQAAGAGGDESAAAGGPRQQKKKKKGRSKGGGGGSKKKGGGGTAAGNLCRLLCFCPKHKNAQLPGPKVTAIHASNASAPTPTRVAVAAAAAVGGARLGAASPLPFGLVGQPQVGGAVRQRLDLSAAAAGGGGNGGVPSQQHALAGFGSALSPGRAAAVAAATAHRVPPGTCARSRPADAAMRRGPRAPEALEAGLRKRLYVRRLPYLVTHRPPREGRPLLPPPARGARFEGPEFEADRSGVTAPPAAALGVAAAGGSGSSVAAAAAAGRGAGAGATGRHLSQAERFARMVATASDRVAAGKSAIHGWGAFAKVPHRAGDMVVEYAGSLVRPCVADTLERRHYNKVVGAGALGGWGWWQVGWQGFIATVRKWLAQQQEAVITSASFHKANYPTNQPNQPPRHLHLPPERGHVCGRHEGRQHRPPAQPLLRPLLPQPHHHGGRPADGGDGGSRRDLCQQVRGCAFEVDGVGGGLCRGGVAGNGG